MDEKKRQEKNNAMPPNTLIVWGASLAAACLMFAALLLIILLMGRVSVGLAFAWAAGAALVTMALVALTGLAFFRLPMGGTFRRKE